MRLNLLFKIIALFVFCVLAILAFAFLSEPVLSFADVAQADSLNHYIFWQLRLPRAVLAFAIGAALSVSGVSFQALLKNPLADPYILGVSGGAALGYVLGVVLGMPFFLLPVLAFVSSLACLILIYKLAQTDGVLSVTNLLLVGIVFNAFSFALILLINSVAHFGQAQQILYLLLGSLDPLPWSRLLLILVFLIFGFCFLWLRAKEMNILSLGDEDAFHLGVNVQREKILFFTVTSLLVGASVSLCGLIGFVGLIVPHLARLLIGADHRLVLPTSALLGGSLLLFCEFLAAHLIGFETLNTRLPVGAVTALIGAPLFVILLKRQVRS
ncbi:MAG: iron ABC transporter permease [Deltaproteobacteria bacterium]|nr:iron ABC transporter permease [Deltaproteobacteria bacterium]